MVVSGVAAMLTGCHVSEAKPVWTNRDFVTRSPVVLAGGVVLLVGTKDGATKLWALGAGDGAVRWSTGLDRVADAGVGLVQAADMVFVVDDQTVAAFGIGDGQKRWLTRTIAPGTVDGLYVSTAPVSAGGKVLFAGKLWSRVVAVDAATGQAAWRTPANGDAEPQALAVHGDVVLSYGYNSVVASGLADGVQRWQLKIMKPAMNLLRDSVRLGPELGELVLAVDASTLLGIDRASGKERWRYQTKGPLSVGGSMSVIVLADGNHTIGIDPATGKARWTSDGSRAIAPLDGKSSLAISGSKAFVVSHADGKVLASASVSTKDDLRILAAAGNKVVFGDVEHTWLAAFDGGKLVLSEIGDHPRASGAVLTDRRFTDVQSVEAVTDGSMIVTQAKSGAINAYK